MLTDKITLTGSMSYAKVDANQVIRAHSTDGLAKGLLSTPPDFNLRPYLEPQHSFTGVLQIPIRILEMVDINGIILIGYFMNCLKLKELKEHMGM